MTSVPLVLLAYSNVLQFARGGNRRHRKLIRERVGGIVPDFCLHHGDYDATSTGLQLG